MSLTRLRAGESIPAWVLALDAAAFGEAWGSLAAHEAMWMLPERAFARWSIVPAAQEAELLRIAVNPATRKEGLGRKLLEGCMGALRAQGIIDLHLEVRASNRPARALYEACGWLETGLRRGYYGDGEDATLYGKRLG